MSHDRRRHVVNRDRNCRVARIGRAVVGLIGEGVGAGVVGGGRVGERAVGVEGERAVGGAGDERGSECVAIGVGIVVQDAGAGGQYGVFVDGVAVAVGDGGVIRRRGIIDGNRNRR